MKVLLSWLRDHVEWKGGAAELAELLTGAGFPVVAIEDPDGDPILDVEVTSNRGDVLSHLGVAREVAAASGRPLRAPKAPSLPAGAGSEDAAALVPVSVEAPDLCPAYGARVLLAVDNRGATPPAAAKRLTALGQRLVNPVVDATNYVLLDRGQPLHAFDRAKLRGGRIVVRRSRAGESIETIDGKVRKLPAGLLVIADAERPVAVAGVMGGRDTEVGAGTKEVVLESARFSPAAVRASTAALGISSEAASRFSRRIDTAEREASGAAAAVLLVEWAKAKPARGESTAGPEAGGAPAVPGVALRFARLDRLLGYPVPREEAIAALGRLGLEASENDAFSAQVRIPSWRGDLSIEEDLVEEVARIRGYDLIPIAVSLPVRPVKARREERLGAAARDALVAAGFHEALTLPFVAPGPLDDASPWTDRAAVRVENPTREEEPLLRRSLLGPLLRCLERNRDRGVTGARLFEIGTAFVPAADGPRPVERLLVSGVAEGVLTDVRAAVDALAEALGLDGRLVADGVSAADHVAPLDRARTARFLLDGATVGWAGEVAVEELLGLGLFKPLAGLQVSAFEFDFEALGNAAVLVRPARPVSAYPVSVRDLSFVLHHAVRWVDLEAMVRAEAGPLLQSVVLFDEFRGKGLPAGTRSLAFRLTFGASERTLRGEEVDEAIRGVVAAVEKRLGGALRKA